MLYWIWLSQIKGIGPITQKKLLKHFGSPRRIYNASIDELMKVNGAGKSISQNIQSTNLERASWILDRLQKLKINLLTYDDPVYPELAKHTPNAPILLYYRGVLKYMSQSVGIVGTRRCTEYGKYVAFEAAGYMAEKGIPVISGMAKGIDGYAHTACLKANGYTAAFLGSGVDICYPSEHKKLMRQIIENGAVISEYPPGTQPKAEHFPKRNALIAAWSEKLLIVEAAEKSGALLTAKYAKEFNREIFAAPNQIYTKTSQGTNRLIAEGGHIYLFPQQIYMEKPEARAGVKDIPADSMQFKNTNASLRDNRIYTAEEQSIIYILNCNGSLTLEQIGAKTSISKMELMNIISILELEGAVNLLPGGRYAVPAM